MINNWTVKIRCRPSIVDQNLVQSYLRAIAPQMVDCRRPIILRAILVARAADIDMSAHLCVVINHS